MNQTTDTILLSAIEEGLFPGCAAALFNGTDERVSAEGTLDFDGYGLVSHATLYDIASLTKIVTFIADLQLVAMKAIGLDDPVADWLPFRQKGSIQQMTLRHLLTCGADFDLPDDLRKLGIHLTDPSGRLRFFNDAALLGEPGKTFRYSNLPAFIGGKLIEKVCGKDLETALRELVLEPLGMDDTCFSMRPHRIARTAPTQIVGTAKWESGIVQDPMSRKFLPEHVGIAGLFSSVRNMLSLAKFLGTGLTPGGIELLPERLWRGMVDDQLAGTGHRYGFGIDKPDAGYVDDPVFCDKGVVMSGTSGCYLFACPYWHRGDMHPRPIGGVILANSRRDMPDAARIHREFRRSFVQAFLDDIAE